MCSLVDLNRAFVWSNGENSRENLIALVVDLNLPFWTAIPATDWFMMVDLFPCKWLNFDRTMNWFSIPPNIVWMSIDEMNRYSCTHCLNCWLELKFPFDFWLALLVLKMIWTFSPENDLNFSSCKSLFDLCLIYDGGLISLHCLIFWTNDELTHRDHWLNFQRWSKCWLELIFSFWTVIPVEIVCLST